MKNPFLLRAQNPRIYYINSLFVGLNLFNLFNFLNLFNKRKREEEEV
jgi:hypothetical protein